MRIRHLNIFLQAATLFFFGVFTVIFWVNPLLAADDDIETKTFGLQEYLISYFPGVADKEDEQEGEKVVVRTSNEEKKDLKKRFASYYEPYRNESGGVPRLILDRKKDEEMEKKLKLHELSTICVPGCDPEKDPQKQSFVQIIHLSLGDALVMGDPLFLKCKENYGKEGFVGTIQDAIAVIKNSERSDKYRYTITEAKAIDGKIEVIRYASTTTGEGKDRKTILKPVASQYVGNETPKGTNPNRIKTDPCGFIHGYCYDPYAAWDYLDEGGQLPRTGPCIDEPPFAEEPPTDTDTPMRLITDSNDEGPVAFV